MDPFIEACGLFTDFHDRLIGDLHQAITARVPEQYFVRLGARSYYLTDEERGRLASQKDGASARGRTAKEKNKTRAPASAARGTKGGEPPVQMLAPLELEEKEIFIEIHQVRPERRLVTGIEILSPFNKLPDTPGRDEYLQKRRAFLNGGANLVEIDLLRGGQRMPMRQPWPDSPYSILVSRREQVPHCQVWRAYSSRPLPKIPIPLDRGETDVEIDLQSMVEEIYERAQFSGLIDYRRPISPPLAAAEKKFLAKAPRKRPKRKRVD